MSDFLLENQVARKVIQTLGLPVPVPTPLQRERGPWRERPLEDHRVLFEQAPGGRLGPAVALTLVRAGANPWLLREEPRSHFAEPSEAYARPCTVTALEALADDARFHALVFDATGCRTPESLRALYDFFHPTVRRLRTCGRVVVLGSAPYDLDPAAAATSAALEGFVRSLAKEIGKRGATAQLLRVADGAEAQLEGPLRFFLGRRSAFISGQPVTIESAASSPTPPAWTRPLAGKIALVTGAARGIGAATAERLAAEGAHVVCLDRPADDTLVSRVAQSLGGTVLLADMADPNAPREIAETLQERFGGVDIVVHNAGVTRDKTLARMSPEQWDVALEVNLAGVVRVTEALLAGPLRDHGRILLLSSVAGIAGNMGQTNYAASKAGLIGYVRALGPTLASRHVTVNALAPGFIETRLTAAIPLAIREAGRRLSNLGQGGRPEDVADAITFLASPQASGVRNQVLRVCGGALLGA